MFAPRRSSGLGGSSSKSPASSTTSGRKSNSRTSSGSNKNKPTTTTSSSKNASASAKPASMLDQIRESGMANKLGSGSFGGLLTGVNYNVNNNNDLPTFGLSNMQQNAAGGAMKSSGNRKGTPYPSREGAIPERGDGDKKKSSKQSSTSSRKSSKKKNHGSSRKEKEKKLQAKYSAILSSGTKGSSSKSGKSDSEKDDGPAADFNMDEYLAHPAKYMSENPTASAYMDSETSSYIQQMGVPSQQNDVNAGNLGMGGGGGDFVNQMSMMGNHDASQLVLKFPWENIWDAKTFYFIGTTGCCKTSHIKTILSIWRYKFDLVFVMTNAPRDQYEKHLPGQLIFQGFNESLFTTIVDTVTEWMEQHNGRAPAICIVGDDWLDEKVKASAVLNEFITRSRHSNYTLLLTLHDLGEMKRKARNSAHYIILPSGANAELIDAAYKYWFKTMFPKKVDFLRLTQHFLVGKKGMAIVLDLNENRIYKCRSVKLEDLGAFTLCSDEVYHIIHMHAKQRDTKVRKIDTLMEDKETYLRKLRGIKNGDNNVGSSSLAASQLPPLSAFGNKNGVGGNNFPSSSGGGVGSKIAANLLNDLKGGAANGNSSKSSVAGNNPNSAAPRFTVLKSQAELNAIKKGNPITEQMIKDRMFYNVDDDDDDN